MLNETSDIHRRNIPKILAQWEEQARKSILSSRGLTSLVLKDSIILFLEQITDALSTTIERTVVRAAQDETDVLNFAKLYGCERANQAFHLHTGRGHPRVPNITTRYIKSFGRGRSAVEK